MDNDPRNRNPSNAKGSAKCWAITKAEAQAILAEDNWTLDPEHCFGDKAYVSDRGELLFYAERGRSMLYASRAELMQKKAESRNRPPTKHMLEGLLPQGPYFIEAVPSLIEDLAKRLQLPRESLDRSIESLEAVDVALKAVRPSKKILVTPGFFASLVAYVGEVMRRQVGGDWHLREVPDGIYEPYICVGPELHPHLDPFSGIYMGIAEPAKGGLSLTAIASGEIMGFQSIAASRRGV